jgi:hypothetical protein
MLVERIAELRKQITALVLLNVFSMEAIAIIVMFGQMSSSGPILMLLAGVLNGFLLAIAMSERSWAK